MAEGTVSPAASRAPWIEHLGSDVTRIVAADAETAPAANVEAGDR